MLFDQPGKTNTLTALEAAAARGRDRGIDEIVLATTKGETALVLKPAHAAMIFDLKIRAIICKPRDYRHLR